MAISRIMFFINIIQKKIPKIHCNIKKKGIQKLSIQKFPFLESYRRLYSTGMLEWFFFATGFSSTNSMWSAESDKCYVFVRRFCETFFGNAWVNDLREVTNQFQKVTNNIYIYIYFFSFWLHSPPTLENAVKISFQLALGGARVREGGWGVGYWRGKVVWFYVCGV